MALRWGWDFGMTLATQFYRNSSQWGVTGNDAAIDTANTANLVSPSGAGTPGEQAVVRMNLTSTALFTPDVSGLPSAAPAGAIVAGWFSTRWRVASGAVVGTGSLESTNPIFRLREAATERIRLAADFDGNPVPLELFVNGVSVGTTARLIGDASSYVLAVDFDMAAGPDAGLTIDGVREIALTAGGAGGAGIDNAELRSGAAQSTTVYGSHGLLLFFDSLADDGGNANYWGSALNADAVTDGDASWSIFGGAGSKVIAVSDRLATTGIETTTDPDTVTIGFEDTTDILAGWLPTTILMVIGVAVGSADVIDQATVDLDDGAGSALAVTQTLSAVQNFVPVYSTVNSGATAWTAAQVNAATYDYDVST